MKNKPENRNLQITRRAVCILAVCVTVVILGTAGLCLYFVYNKKPVWTQADLTVTQEVLHNPYCGWYQIYGYTLTDESQTAGQNPAWSVLDTKISAAVAQSESANDRLALLQINLKQFADRDLTENALAELKHILTRWEESSCSLILRFLYDWDGNAQSTEPNDISQIEKHMRQCAQILNEHKDNIYLVQGIFIGNYGEMHHSRFSSEEEQIQLFTVLRGSLDDEIYMAVRTPAQLRAVLAAEEAAADLLLYGHTHRATLFQHGNLWVMNPGTCCGTHPATYGIVEIENGGISCQIKSLDASWEE